MVGSVRLTERDVVRLERARVRRVGVGQDDKRVRIARRGERGVVDARDARSESDREVRRDVRDLKLVKHHRLCT